MQVVHKDIMIYLRLFGTVNLCLCSAAEYTDGMMPANAMIRSNGKVFWPVPSKLQSTCKVDVTYFPFDDQKCRLKFGSWTYDGFQVTILNLRPTAFYSRQKLQRPYI